MFKLQNNQKDNKGFTLIELLVVISIISLLSSIVLASLNSARSKARDVAVKQGVAQFVNLLNLNYSDYGSYSNLNAGWISQDGLCSSFFSGNYAAQARTICAQMYSNAGAGLYYNPINTIYISANPTSYSIMINLSAFNIFYCSGSSGAKSELA